MLMAIAVGAGFLIWWRKRRRTSSPLAADLGGGPGVDPKATTRL